MFSHDVISIAAVFLEIEESRCLVDAVLHYCFLVRVDLRVDQLILVVSAHYIFILILSLEKRLTCAI